MENAQCQLTLCMYDMFDPVSTTSSAALFPPSNTYMLRKKHNLGYNKKKDQRSLMKQAGTTQ